MLVSRRHLIAATPLLLAGFAAGNAYAADARQWDLIVVGAGTAGLPAALFAAQRGACVLLLEKSTQIGGTLWFSGGQMSAANTRRQRAMGIIDSAQTHFDDIVRISQGTADPDLVRRAVTEAGPTLDWLEEAGFDFGDEYPLIASGHEPYSQRRVWGGKERGMSVLGLLEREMGKARRKPVLKTDFEVSELLQDLGGAVKGVRGRDGGGKLHDFHAAHVILASGGYMTDPQRFEALNGVPQYRTGWSPTNTGIGVTLALAAGGRTRGRENYLCDFGSIPMDLEVPSAEFARSLHHPDRRPPWEIWVNAEGRRFVREDEPSVDTRERALFDQPHHRYWIVFDQAMLDNAPTLVRSAPPSEIRDWTRDELRDAFGTVPAFAKGDTIEALAANAGIDAAGLRESIAHYNAGVAAGRDSLGRTHMPRPIGDGPYYAIRNQGGTLISIAGVAVDGDLRVLRAGGQPVPGLYAVGELLGNGSLSGKAFCSGMMVTPALALGRWLGRSLPIV